MNVSLKNADLAREWSLLEKIVARKVVIPVLSNVLLSATEMGHVRLLATDLEVGLTGGCAADVIEPGEVTLPAKKFLDLLRAQSDPMVTLTSEPNGSVRLAAGPFKSRLQSLPATEFPAMPAMDGLPVTELPKLGLRRALEQVRFAISDKEQTRYYMKAAFMSLTDKKMTFVATDTSRLALSTAVRNESNEETALLPSKCVGELLALLDNDDGVVQFARNDQHLFFKVDDRILFSRQIDGQFPAFTKVIPENNSKVVMIPRDQFAAIIRRHALIHDVVVLLLGANILHISSASPEIGDSTEQLAVEYTGEPVEIKFRGAYVLDFLEAAKTDQIQLRLNDSFNPALFTSGEYLNVIMGMRV